VTIADLTIFWGETSGGVRTYLSRKRAFLAARGHRHLLVVPGAADSVRDDREGRTVTLRAWPAPLAPGYRVILRRRAVEAALLRERPDLVEVGDPYLLPWAAYRARARAGTPVVLFVHSDFVEAYLRPAGGAAAAALGWAYARQVYRRADLVLAPSSVVSDRLAAHGIARVEVIPFGVDVDRFHPARRREAVRREIGAGDRGVCLFVGRLSPEKGLETLLRALPRLGEAGVALWVAGSGRLERKVREAAARYAVRVLGFLDPDRLADVYAAADVVALPSPRETFGLAALEALASGVPVVAAAGGGPASWLTAEVGRVVPPGDPAALAGAVLALAAERGARREACRRFAEAYAWEPALARLLARYARLVAERRPVDVAIASAEASARGSAG
jgi:alpha-1,6-mannosyltransferase